MSFLEIIESAHSVIKIVFIAAWVIKVIFYNDQYETGAGKIGSMIMCTFTIYKKHEIEDADNTRWSSIRMRINNICGYVMLASVILYILGLFVGR